MALEEFYFKNIDKVSILNNGAPTRIDHKLSDDETIKESTLDATFIYSANLPLNDSFRKIAKLTW